MNSIVRGITALSLLGQLLWATPIAKPDESVLPLIVHSVNLPTGSAMLYLPFGLILYIPGPTYTSIVPAGPSIYFGYDFRVEGSGKIPTRFIRAAPYFALDINPTTGKPVHHGVEIQDGLKINFISASGSYWNVTFVGTNLFWRFYKSSGLIDSVVRNSTILKRFRYDSSKRLTRIEDLYGNRQDFAYNANGKLVSVTHRGVSFSVSYNATGTLSQITKSGCNWAARLSLAPRRIDYYESPVNQGLSFERYADGTIYDVFGSVGNTTGQPIRNGPTVTFAYDSVLGKVEVRDPETLSSYHFAFQPIKRIAVAEYPNASVYYSYSNGSANEAAVYLPKAIVTQINPTTPVNPKPSYQAVAFEREANFGLPIAISTAAQREERIYNSKYGFLVNRKTGEGIQTAYHYDRNWNLESISSSNNHSTVYSRTSQGFVTAVKVDGIDKYLATYRGIFRTSYTTPQAGVVSNIVYSSLNGFKNTEVGKNLGDGSRYSLAIAPLTSGFIFTQITRPPSANSNPPIEESWTVNCASDLQAQSSLTSSTNISYSSNATQTTETVATTFSGGIENQEQSTIPGSLMVLRSWWRGTNGEQDNTCEMHGTGCTGPRSPGMTCCGTGCLAEGTWQPKCICGDDPPPTGGGTSGGSGSGGGSTGGGGGGCDPVGGSATVNDITQSAACGVGCRTNVDCPRGFCCNNGNCATACGISGNSDNGGVLEW